ncbi:MAG: succinylglutamate desuccinylase [Clostridiales bacterium]|nr:succinylglutamate desuccinylase [Clostridiales bacterium]
MLKVNDLTALRGEKVHGYLSVKDEEKAIPITLISGKNEGKCLVITAGVHGGEYAGIEAAIRFMQELDPAKMAGDVIIISPANLSGFFATLHSIVAVDGKNLNRCFPGDAEGSYTEQLAHAISSKVFPLADLYLDLHCGDLHEGATPYAYIPLDCAPEVTSASFAASEVLNIRYRRPSLGTGNSYASAAKLGVPSILLERAGRGIWEEADVKAFLQDLRSMAIYLGILQGEVERHPMMDLVKEVDARTQTEGLWYPMVNPGDEIRKGQKLGELRDVFGNVLQEPTAQGDGAVLYTKCTLAIRKGGLMVCYGLREDG